MKGRPTLRKWCRKHNEAANFKGRHIYAKTAAFKTYWQENHWKEWSQNFIWCVNQSTSVYTMADKALLVWVIKIKCLIFISDFNFSVLRKYMHWIQHSGKSFWNDQLRPPIMRNYTWRVAESGNYCNTFLHVFLYSYGANTAPEFATKLQRQTQTETHNISVNILYFSLLKTAKCNCKNAQTVRLYV